MEVKATATSPERLPLSYQWADGNGDVLPGNEAAVQWHLPATSALNTLFVEVSDGHGGIDRGSIHVTTASTSTATISKPPSLTGVAQGIVVAPPKFVFKQWFVHSGFFIDPDAMTSCGSLASCKTEAALYYQTLGVQNASGAFQSPYRTFKEWKTF